MYKLTSFIAIFSLISLTSFGCEGIKFQDGDNSQTVSVLSLGAKGDGVSDDAPALQKAISYCIQNRKVCYIPKTSRFYNIRSTVRVPLEPGQSIKITSNGAIIKPVGPLNSSGAFKLTSFNENIFLSIGKQLPSVKDPAVLKLSEGTAIDITGLIIDGSYLQEVPAPTNFNTPILMGIQALAETVNMSDCTFQNIYGYGMTIYNVKNSKLNNCKFLNVGGRGATPFAQKIDRDAFGDGVHYTLVKADGVITIQNCIFNGKKVQNKRSRSAITFEYSTLPYKVFLTNDKIAGFAAGIHIEETAPTVVRANNIDIRDCNFDLVNVLNNSSVIYLDHSRLDVGFSDGNDNGDAQAFLNYRSKAQIFVNNSYLNFNGRKQAYQSTPGLVKVENSTINGNQTNLFFADGSTVFTGCTFIGFGGAGKSFSGNALSNYKIINSNLKKSKRIHADGQKLKLSIEGTGNGPN
jgi:hypothetical protein